jgi:hypothetical protein
MCLSLLFFVFFAAVLCALCGAFPCKTAKAFNREFAKKIIEGREENQTGALRVFKRRDALNRDGDVLDNFAQNLIRLLGFFQG